MTKIKFTIAVMVIGMLMLLVLPVCAAPLIVSGVTPNIWTNGTPLVLYVTSDVTTPFPTNWANVQVILNKTGQVNQTSTFITAGDGTFVNVNFASPRIMYGPWNVTVVNISDPSSNVLQAGSVDNELLVYNDPPTLTSIDTDWAYNNSPFTFTLTGTGFFTTPTVNLSFASSPYTNITANIISQSSTSITGTFPLTGVQAGAYTVNLTNPDGKISVTPPLTLPFTIFCPAPTITDVIAGEPSNSRFITNSIANVNAPVKVKGTGFRNDAEVNISITNSTGTVFPIPILTVFLVNPDGKEISFYANFSGQNVGLYNVTVTNPGPLYNNTTQPNYFTVYYPGAPIIDFVNPNYHENITNVSVTILGHNFYPGATVWLNKTTLPDVYAPASPFVVSADNTIIQCNLTTNGTATGRWNLVVMNNDSQVGRLLEGFEVTTPPGPTASFFTSPTPATGPVPLDVAFNDTSTGSPTTWTWNFGDGTTYTPPDFAHRNTTHTYAAGGTFQANLTVSNAYGSSTSANQPITPYVPWVTPGGPTTHPVAIDGDANNMYIAATSPSPDNKVYFNSYNYSTTHAWTGWKELGSTTMEPTIAVADGFVHVIAICPADNGIYTRRYNIGTGAWSLWEPLNGPTFAPVALIAGTSPTLTGDHLFIAAKGTDNAVYVKQWTTATGWTGFLGSSDWTAYGGNIQSSPALAFAPSTTGAAPDHANVLTISARNGGDNVVYIKDVVFSSPVFYYTVSPWTATGMSSLNTPSVTRGVTGSSKAPLYVVVQGTDNVVYLQSQTGSTWSAVSSLGSSTTNKPAIYMDRVNNRISTVISGTPTANAYVSFFNCNLNTNSAWQSLDKLLAPAPNNPSFSSGYSTGSSSYPYIAVRGANNEIYLKNIVYG